MTSLRTRASRHRDERGVVAPSRLMLVAIVVVAIGAAMFFATSPGAKDDPAPAAAKPSAAASATPSTPAASEPASSAPAEVTPSAEPSESATPTPAATPKPSATPTRTPSAATGSVDKATTRVAVFNNSTRKGLAQQTASKVTAAGWQVTGTDNWRGNIPATTVYFPKGMRAAARSLAADLGIDRVKAAQSPMRDDRLTVILT